MFLLLTLNRFQATASWAITKTSYSKIHLLIQLFSTEKQENLKAKDKKS